MGNTIRDHISLFEGFWDSKEVADQIINSLTDGDLVSLTSDDVYALIDEFVEMGDSPHMADRDEIAQEIFDRLPVDFENQDVDLNKHGIEPEGEYEDYQELVADDSYRYESVDLSDITSEMLNEAPRRMPPVAPVDDSEDEFAAPERVVDVGDDEDYEDNLDDLNLDDLGIDTSDADEEYNLGLRFD